MQRAPIAYGPRIYLALGEIRRRLSVQIVDAFEDGNSDLHVRLGSHMQVMVVAHDQGTTVRRDGGRMFTVGQVADHPVIFEAVAE